MTPKMSLKERIRRVRAWIAARMPTTDFWLGAGRAHVFAALVILTVAGVLFASVSLSVYSALGVGLGIVLIFLISGLLHLAMHLIARTPSSVRWGAALFLVTAAMALIGNDIVLWVSMAALFIGVGLLGGGLAVRQRRGWRWQSVVPVCAGGTVVLAWLVAYWMPDWPTEESIVWQPMRGASLTLDDPGLPGTHTWQLAHYGTGEDPQRAEFGDDVDFITPTVDGSKLLEGWEGRNGWGRSNYFNAGPDHLPVQGRVWLPDGDGPFPIVLIVHGNHGMEDFSDTGYAYLGEHFASRGIIAVSVDENFFNSSYANLLGVPDVGLEEENDARGWLLLKHLEQWRAWNADPQHPLHGKADLGRVVLIGHSRGGEAVSEAAVFNALPAYPDDATEVFNFGFGLRGVIAIAPVDAQYHPRNDITRVRNVSYLVIHGSHDGDVTSYAGYSTYSRTQFDSCRHCFKTGFYLLGANHGQFNTSWGRSDFSLPPANVLNHRHIMDGEAQRAVARSLFSAFLEVTLKGDEQYRPWLASPDRASQLFPQGVRFLSQFRDAGELVLLDYSEDDDVSTGTAEGVHIESAELALWKEQEISLKWHKANTAAAVIGWQDTAAYYAITLPRLNAAADATLNLSLAPSSATPGELEAYETPEETDFSLVLHDAHGQQAALPLSTRRSLPKLVEPIVYKLHSLQKDRSETVFQRYRFELGEWLEENPALNLSALTRLELRFDRTPASAIVLEQITYSAEGL